MSKVIEVQGSLQFDEDESSDSEDEAGDDNLSTDAPLVFVSDSDEEELEIFHAGKGDSTAPVSNITKKSSTAKVATSTRTASASAHSPKKEVEEVAPQLSLLSAMANAVQAIEQENNTSASGVETEDDVDFSRQDAALQRQAAALKQQKQKGEMSSGSSDTFDFSSRSNPLDSSIASGAASSDSFGIAYKPYLKKKSSYELPKGPAFEDEVEFEREMLASSGRSGGVSQAVPGGGAGDESEKKKKKEEEEDDEFDFEEVDVSAPRRPVVLPVLVEPSLLEDPLLSEPEGCPEQEEGAAAVSNKAAGETAAVHVQEDEEEEENFRESSRKALAEIKDVYSSGLGDHEIVLLRAEEEREKRDPLSSEAVMLDMRMGKSAGAGAVIEEIDEEEYEREEEEAEQRVQEQLSNEERSRLNLQTQWDNVDVMQANAGPGAGAGGANAQQDGDFKVMKYLSIEKFFRQQDLSEHRDKLVIDSEDSSSWSLLSKSSRLSKCGLSRAEIELPFLIAQVAYSPEHCPEHLNILRNIYKSLVRSVPTLPPPVGAHWEAIGFQGLDPSTDLNRSMKMLTILQVMHMLEKESSLSLSLFNNSLGTAGALQQDVGSGGRKPIDTSWPFMCVAIGMTKNSIDALRAGVLTKYAVRYKSALEALHEYHHACFYCFLRSLTSNPHVHHAEHLNTIRKEVSSNPLGLLRAYRKSKEVNNEKDRAREKKKNASKSGGGDDDAETTAAMYDVGSENDLGGGEGGEGSEDQGRSSSRRGSWKNMFSLKDDKAKKFMA